MAPTSIISLIQSNFPVTVSESETGIYADGPKEATIDGNTNNYWTTPWGFRHWWMVDLKAGWGSNVVVTRVTLTNG